MKESLMIGEEGLTLWKHRFEVVNEREWGVSVSLSVEEVVPVDVLLNELFDLLLHIQDLQLFRFGHVQDVQYDVIAATIVKFVSGVIR